MQAPDEFRSLAELLREAPAVPTEPAMTVQPAAEYSAASRDEIAAARDARLFRARLAEALESAVATLRADIAAEIVARELRLAPADVAEIVRRAVRRGASEHPIRLRVHPDDLRALETCGIDTAGDDGLRRGDAVLEYGAGEIDFSLGVRLDAVLRGQR